MIAIMSAELDSFWRRAGRERELVDGETLFRSGQPVRALHRIAAGTVELVRILPHGANLTLQVATPGSLLAEASLFATHYHCDAVARDAARVRSVPVGALRAALVSDRALAGILLGHLAGEVHRARARAEIVALRTVAERLDAWLSLGGGHLPPRGGWRELAGELAVSPEALYRELAIRRRKA